MIDFHSHILPGIDDGSKSIEESLAMLEMLSEQNITKVVATSHFYANHNSVEKFITQRNEAYDKLLKSRRTSTPEILLGAEVKYYEGISRLENLENLCIGDTKLLLLEMYMGRWSNYTLREISELSSSCNIKIVLAHIERYLRLQDFGLIHELVERGILVQANAEFFLNLRNRHKAFSMLKNGLIHFIGSDCHGLAYRPPRIGDAYALINRKLGNGFLAQMSDFADSCLK